MIAALCRWLIRLTAPAGAAREGLLGDLLELHRERCRGRPTIIAHMQLIAECLHAAARYPAARLNRRWRRWRSARRPIGETMAHVMQNLRYGLRGLRAAPGFTAAVVVTAALGIGATTTIFSVVNAVLFTTPPGVRQPDELVTLHRVSADGSSFHAFSYPNFLDYRAADNGMRHVAVWSTTPVALGTTGEPVALIGMMVSHDYFEALGTRPALGRLLRPEDDTTIGDGFVTVLSHRAWQQRFGADSAIVGQTVTLNRHAFTVVGVAEPEFAGHSNIVDVSVWVPVTTANVIRDMRLEDRRATFLEMIGRRADGVSFDQARTAMEIVAANLATAHPEANQDETIDVRPYAAMFAPTVGPMRAFSALLFAVSGIILVIACVNVGGMLLARATRRGREMAVRMALGARRAQLVRQLLTESVLLFTIGGVAGVALTVYVTRLLNAFQLPIPVPIIFDFSPDLRALGFSVGVAVLTGVSFGLAPALHVTRPHLSTTLKQSADTGRTRNRLRSTFVVAQVAGSTLLLIGAGLLARGLARADAIDLGFSPADVHILTTDLEVHRRTPEEAATFYDELMTRIRALPVVESAGLIDMLPIAFGNQTTVFAIDGRDPSDNVGRFDTDFASISPGYLSTLRIPMAAGRDFTPADREDAPMVAIVNETVARRVWPGESAVGRRLQFGSFREPTELEVIGVARDAKYRSLSDVGRNMIYVPIAQWPETGYTVVARIEGDHAAVTTAFRGILRDLEPELPVEVNAPYRSVLGLSLLPNRAAALLSTIFGIAGAVLAAIGLYGVLAYTVSIRTREIGIRMALGAQHRNVSGLILGHGLRLAAIGLVIGGAAAVAVTRLMRGLLYGVSPVDPVTYLAIATGLVGVAWLASYVPARRAMRTDPVTALRTE